MTVLFRCSLILGLCLFTVSPGFARGWGLFRSSNYYSSSYYYPSYYAGYYSSYYPSNYYSSYYYPFNYSAGYYAPAYYPSTFAYYVPTPLYVEPAVECAPSVVVAPQTAAPNLAQPTQAPPSQVNPPAAPKVKESRAFYQPYADVTQTSTSNREDVCQVGFWNLTQRDLTVKINGQDLSVPRGRMTTVAAPRQFVWRYDQGKTNLESIPQDRKTMEIVIRR